MQASDWRPIESAPWPTEIVHDDQRVLVATDRGRVGEVKLHCNGWGYGASGTSFAAIQGAHTASLGRVGVDDGERMTHWMPLPPPPAQED